MNQKVTAIYENCVLRPLTPLDLPEHSEVRIELQQVSAPAAATTPDDTLACRVRRALVAAGLSQSAGAASETITLPEHRRNELAHRFSAARPLSDLIREDRESRP